VLSGHFKFAGSNGPATAIVGGGGCLVGLVVKRGDFVVLVISFSRLSGSAAAPKITDFSIHLKSNYSKKLC